MNICDSGKFLLLSVLLAMTACDDAQIGPEDFGAGAVELRCVGCGGTGFNTNVAGGYSTAHWPKQFGQPADNGVGQMTFESATVPHLNVTRDVISWNITSDGHLQVVYLSSGKKVVLKGTEVRGTVFQVVYEPNDAPVFKFTLEITGVSCQPGKYEQSEKICSYTIVTDAVPTDPGYPAIIFTKYVTCLDDDNNGALSSSEKFDLVFAKNTRFDAMVPGGHVEPDDSLDLAQCLNGALSHDMFYLNVYRDWAFDPRARTLDASQPDATLHAWMAWFDGAPRTEPGHQVCFLDPIGNLFNENNCTAVLQWEGAYGASGQVCRASNGSHRHVFDALTNIPGYAALPVCTPANYTDFGGLIGVYSLPAVAP